MRQKISKKVKKKQRAEQIQMNIKLKKITHNFKNHSSKSKTIKIAKSKYLTTKKTKQENLPVKHARD